MMPSFARLLALAVLVLAAPAGAASDDTVWTLAGTGAEADSGDGGQAREAAINQPRAVAAIPDGGYVWAEPWTHRVRIVDANGIVRTLAGDGTAGFAGDGGPATAAKLNFVHAAEPTADGGFLIADTWNDRIRKVSAAGIITTVAGTGVRGYSGDGGPATSAMIDNPRSVVPLADGGFLIPDSNNHRVRRVSAAGTITTVAGTGVRGFAGDGGAAVDAQLSTPFAVAPTQDGGFLIADMGNQRIRKVSPTGTITTVAGTGAAGYGGDGGPATAADIFNPHDVVELPDGGFLIADTWNHRVRRVAPDGVITTFIGDGAPGYSGDGGTAAAARISFPKGVSVTPAGDILIADEQNQRIRFVGTIVAPASTLAPSISGVAAQGQQLTAAAGGWSGTGPLISYQWQRCSPACANIGGAVAKTYTVAAADGGATLRVAVTASNPAGTATAFSPETATVVASGPPASSGGGGSSGGTTTPVAPIGSGGGAQPPAVITPPAPTTPAKPALSWLVRAGRDFQRAGEYTVRTRNTRLVDAIAAYGNPSCRVVTARHVVATWAARGIQIDARTKIAVPKGRTGCSSPGLMYVSEIRLADRRWVTALGLRVGDGVAKLRRLYPRAPYVAAARGSSRNEYSLVRRHGRCVGTCTAAQKRNGVAYPRLTAQVKGGRVIAFWLPVFGQPT